SKINRSAIAVSLIRRASSGFVIGPLTGLSKIPIVILNFLSLYTPSEIEGSDKLNRQSCDPVSSERRVQLRQPTHTGMTAWCDFGQDRFVISQWPLSRLSCEDVIPALI